MHHPRVDLERLFIKRENGRRSVIQLELTYKTNTIRLNILKDYHWLDATLYKHTRRKRKHNSIHKENNKFAKHLDLTLKEIDIKDQAPLVV